jgi:uracil-DNA glycosylase
MYKEIAASCKGYKIPDDGCLDHWAKQGVFLINTCLTCPVGNAGGHSKFNIWIPFISSVLKLIGETNKECFYMLWGKTAQECKSYISGKADRILCTSHPSPLSASRGFMGCGHFAAVNKKLIPPIKW